jgi:hypothetical protein
MLADIELTPCFSEWRIFKQRRVKVSFQMKSNIDIPRRFSELHSFPFPARKLRNN